MSSVVRPTVWNTKTLHFLSERPRKAAKSHIQQAETNKCSTETIKTKEKTANFW